MFDDHERGGRPRQTASTSRSTGTAVLACRSSTASVTRGPDPGSTDSAPSAPCTDSGPRTPNLIVWPPNDRRCRTGGLCTATDRRASYFHVCQCMLQYREGFLLADADVPVRLGAAL